MVRAILGFVVGLAIWMPAFFVMTFSIARVWPAYAVHGREWFESGAFTFEPRMAAVNVVCWALAAVLAGWIAVVVAGRREPAWVLAAVLALYLGLVHLVLYWSNFPWWYNLGVALLAAPAVLLGGKLGGRFARPSVLAAAR